MKFGLGDKVLITCADLKTIFMKCGKVVDAFKRSPESRDYYIVEIENDGKTRVFTVFENEMRPA